MGKIKKPEPSLFRYEEALEHELQSRLAGKEYSPGILKTEEGKAALAEAEAAVKAQFGQSYVEAAEADLMESLERRLKWAQEKSGKDELEEDCCESLVE